MKAYRPSRWPRDGRDAHHDDADVGWAVTMKLVTKNEVCQFFEGLEQSSAERYSVIPRKAQTLVPALGWDAQH